MPLLGSAALSTRLRSPFSLLTIYLHSASEDVREGGAGGSAHMQRTQTEAHERGAATTAVVRPTGSDQPEPRVHAKQAAREQHEQPQRPPATGHRLAATSHFHTNKE